MIDIPYDDAAKMQEILQSADCLEAIADWALRHGQVEHQAAYIIQPGRPQKVIAKFLRSKYPEVVSWLIQNDDMSYVKWAQGLGFPPLRKPRADRDSPELRAKVQEWLDAPDDQQFALWSEMWSVQCLRQEVDDWVDNAADKNVDLWKQLVPEEGCAETLQGELVRAIGKIEGEYFRNGMMNWGDGYYGALNMLIHSTLKKEKSFSRLVKKVIDADIAVIEASGKLGEKAAKGEESRFAVLGSNTLFNADVQESFHRVDAVITVWCARNPEPIPYSAPT